MEIHPKESMMMMMMRMDTMNSMETLMLWKTLVPERSIIN
jgi:hypothetical protein